MNLLSDPAATQLLNLLQGYGVHRSMIEHMLSDVVSRKQLELADAIYLADSTGQTSHLAEQQTAYEELQAAVHNRRVFRNAHS